jgi:hypothetical protein
MKEDAILTVEDIARMLGCTLGEYYEPDRERGGVYNGNVAQLRLNGKVPKGTQRAPQNTIPT